MTAALGRMDEFRLHVRAPVADRGHRRRARRAALPDRCLLRRAGGGLARRALLAVRAEDGGRRRLSRRCRSGLRRASATWAASWRATSSATGFDVVTHDIGPRPTATRGRRFVDDVGRGGPSGRSSSSCRCPTAGVRRGRGGDRRRTRRHARVDRRGHLDHRRRGRPRRCTPSWPRPVSTTSTPRCLVVSPGPGRARCRSCTPAPEAALPGTRARAGRVERPAPPVGTRPGYGTGPEAGQQFPVCDGVGRRERSHRLRHLGRPRHGDDARGHRRLEWAERGDQRQVPAARPHRPATPPASPIRSWPRTWASTWMRPTGRGTPSVVSRVTASVWERFAREEPGVDFTRIYPFVAGR